MDPQDGLIQLTRLGLMKVVVDGEEVTLQEASLSQRESLRASRSRVPAVQAAKRGLHIYEELPKLEEMLDLVEQTQPQGGYAANVFRAGRLPRTLSRARERSGPSCPTSPGWRP
jgi:hypothetical protein